MNSYFYNNMNMFHPTMIRNQYPLHLQYLYPYTDPYGACSAKPAPTKAVKAADCAYKNEIMRWISTLAKDEMSSLFAIRNQETVFLIMKMFAHETLRAPSLYAKKENFKGQIDLVSNIEAFFMVRHRTDQPRSEHEIMIQAFRVTGNFEAIMLQDHVLDDFTQFLERMDLLTDGNLFSVQPRVTSSRKSQTVEDAIWFNASSFQSFSSWLLNALEKEIALAYFKSRRHSEPAEQDSQLQDLKTYWVSCDRNQRMKLFNLGLREIKTDKEKKLEESQWLAYLQSFHQEEDFDQKYRSFCDEKGDDLIDWMIFSQVNPITCAVKRLYKILASQYRDFLERDLIETEESERRLKNGKGKRKRKQKPKDKQKLPCLTESDTESKPSFQTKNCFLTTPPNSTLDTPLSKSKKSSFCFEEIELQNERANQAFFKVIFEETIEIPSEDTQLSQSTVQTMVQLSLQCLNEKEEYEKERADEKRKNRKRMKRQEKNQKLKESMKESQKDSAKEPLQELEKKDTCQIVEDQPVVTLENRSPAVVKEEEEEITFPLKMKEEVVARNHGAGTTTAPTSEEEFIKIHHFQGKKKKVPEQRDKKPQGSQYSCKSGKSKPSAPYTYKSYYIKSDSSLKLARSNNFPRKSENSNVVPSEKLNPTPPIDEVIEQVAQQENVQNQIEEEATEIVVPLCGNQKTVVQDLSKIASEETKASSEETKASSEEAESLLLEKTDSQSPISEAGCGQSSGNTVGQDERVFLEPTVVNERIWAEAEEMMLEKLSQDATDFAEEILNECQWQLPYREKVYLRIMRVVKGLFTSIPTDVRLYGSCSTGLALPSSDIDIFITGFEYFPKCQLADLMNELVKEFYKQPWVITQEAIFASSIPVLRMEIDPLVYDDIGKMNLSSEQAKELEKRKQTFKVDLTFISFPEHLGHLSTEQIKEWRDSYQHLQHLVILLKSIVKNLGLNEAYKGGLSSYSLILMVLAFLKDFSEDNGKEVCLGRVIKEMCQFYGSEFDPKEQGIGIFFQSSSFFPLKAYNLPALPISIMSPISNKIISQSCTYAKNILEELRFLHEQIRKHTCLYYDYLSLKERKKRVRKHEQENFKKQTKDNFIRSTLSQLKKVVLK